MVGSLLIAVGSVCIFAEFHRVSFFDFFFNSVNMVAIVIQIKRFLFYPVVKRKLLHKLGECCLKI